MPADGTLPQQLSPEGIRALRAERPEMRARDFASQHGIAEAELVAAQIGTTATAIEAHPDAIMPRLTALGDVMALTRNESCVIERRGTYEDYHSGAHAQMVLGKEIDLRLFAQHWAHAFALEDGEKRSIQVFDPAGDAIHKVHLKPESDVAAFHALVAALRLPVQSDQLDLAPRAQVEAAKSLPEKAETLRAEWDKLTDTHQFLRLVSKLKMNRLGAYRIAGAPYATEMSPGAVEALLTRCAADRTPLMIFVGNAGCIEIHGGTIETVKPMGPWINVLDPRFNLHLRGDHIAEVWLVDKPTKNGPALSLEAFDKQGALITQIFASRKDGGVEAFNATIRALPHLEGQA
ncbi:hemin-degrading factor [Thioclava sp. F28-4]|uniref:hemin-degrading factor n=1 Tax=Thioclava sp. F28-4 TaxID=1915315 RepID=UPI0011BAB629|nr:ChuX/HutX family heme-like substrate-binding protein [Thioclava sp. F28-4]